MQQLILDAIPTPAANIQRGLAALERALSEKTTVHRAMHREGLGWVDFVWGDEGKWPPTKKGVRKGGRGISHAIEARERKDGFSRPQAIAMLEKVVTAIAKGEEILPRNTAGNSVQVRVVHQGVEVILVKRAGSNAWAVTAYEQWGMVGGGALDAAIGAIQPTRHRPTPCRPMAVAPSVASGDTVPSLDRAMRRDSCKRGSPAGAESNSTLDARQSTVNAKEKRTMETPIIRYNLRERGRQFTGQPRNFNVRAVCDAINSPATQEVVALRTMFGYYGHGPRIRFGLDAVEGGIHAGKYIPVEPAFITTHLKADYDGNVEHRAEFLDTESGRIAEKLWNNKVGGFSSAIDTARPAFHGLDFVLAPNYAANSYRGVALDDAGEGAGYAQPAMTYDAAYALELEERAQGSEMVLLLDNVQAERLRTAAVIERLQMENEQLLSALARNGVKASNVLDAAPVLPMTVALDGVNRLQRDAHEFRSLKNLPQFVAPQPESQPAPPRSRVEGRLLSRFNY